MPVTTAEKVQALSVDFRSQAALAEILGVSRSRVTCWLKGAASRRLTTLASRAHASRCLADG
jgi:hypothetical protein